MYSRTKWGIVFEDWIKHTEVTGTVILLLKWPSYCITASLTIQVFISRLRITVWPSAGKELTSWLSAYAVLLYASLNICVPFPFGVWGRMWLYRFLIIAYSSIFLRTQVSRDMTKPTKWLCAQRRLISVWASAQSDQSFRCPHDESLGHLATHWAHSEGWSDWASLIWVFTGRTLILLVLSCRGSSV